MDTLDSEEFEYAMSSSPDVDAIPGVASRLLPLRCHSCDGEKSDPGECDGTLCEFGKWVGHRKVLSGTKKERNQWVFLWSKVILDKGIANWAIGRI